MIEIVIAIITSLFTFLGVLYSNFSCNKKLEHDLQMAQAVTDCKIEELTREVREHNNFAKRLPVVEEQIKNIYKKIESK